MALVFVEASLAHLPGFPALPIFELFTSFLLVRLVMYFAISRGLGPLRARWLLLGVGSIGTHCGWGLLVAAVQLQVGASDESVVMAFVMCGVATGGVAAFAPSRWLHRATLSVLVLPVVVLALVGSGSVTFAIMHGMFFAFMLVLGRASNRDFWQTVDREDLLRGHAESSRLAAISADATARELRSESEHRAAVELELRQAQKLEAIGRLAAGIAHEINTPVQFVSNSCEFLNEGVAALGAAVHSYRALIRGLPGSTVERTQASASVRQIDEEYDVDYLASNLPAATLSALEGLDRISKIVAATKEFAYPDRREKAPADLNKAIRGTLVIAHHETKHVAIVETELGELPMVLCHCGELNQVVLNLVVNAVHAIAEVVNVTGVHGTIRVRTWATADIVKISIGDTGTGIAPDIVDKIFEPFYTTKAVGSGSGQGLAIARSVVVDKHGGAIDVQSELGVGTVFTITLPIRPL